MREEDKAGRFFLVIPLLCPEHHHEVYIFQLHLYLIKYNQSCTRVVLKAPVETLQPCLSTRVTTTFLFFLYSEDGSVHLFMDKAANIKGGRYLHPAQAGAFHGFVSLIRDYFIKLLNV